MHWQLQAIEINAWLFGRVKHGLTKKIQLHLMGTGRQN